MIMDVGWIVGHVCHETKFNLPPVGEKCNFWSMAATEIVKIWKLCRIACLSRIHHQTSFYTLCSLAGVPKSQMSVGMYVCMYVTI